MDKCVGAQTVLPKIAEKCKECGCICQRCFNINSLDLHHEIEDLRAKLVRSNARIAQIECDMADSQKLANFEMAKLTEETIRQKDRCERLLESHKKLQHVNNNLEEKLLTVVEKLEAEKCALKQDCSSLNTKLVNAKYDLNDLEDENERLRRDCLLAVHMLQCKPSSFIEHKLSTLPIDLQERLYSQSDQQQLESALTGDACNIRNVGEKCIIRVPMATFPPTAMVYSTSRSMPPLPNPDNAEKSVPLTLIAKALTPPFTCRPRRLFVCHRCKADIMLEDKSVQVSFDSYSPSLAHSHVLTSSRLQFLSQHLASNSNQLAKVHRGRFNSIGSDV